MIIYEAFNYISSSLFFIFFQMNFTESFIKVPEVISQCYKNVNFILAPRFLIFFFYFSKLISFFPSFQNQQGISISWNLFRPSRFSLDFSLCCSFLVKSPSFLWHYFLITPYKPIAGPYEALKWLKAFSSCPASLKGCHKAPMN